MSRSVRPCSRTGGRALWQQGRLREGRDALEQALARCAATGRNGSRPAASSCDSRSCIFAWATRRERPSKEPVQLAPEAEPAGPELVSAYAYLAGNRALTGRDREAIEAVDRAIALAQLLGQPEPAFGVHWRGVARLNLGDVGGDR